MAFSVEVEQQDETAYVRVNGELDIQTAPQLAEALDGVNSVVVVDLSGVTFIDSTALGVLVRAHHEAEAKGHQLVLARPTPMARRVLDITALDTVLHITE